MDFTPAFFDEASAAWNMNKKRVGQMYFYICSVEGCNRKAQGLCYMHKNITPDKKLTHNYNLRNRSHNAPVHPFCNS
jgi:hypothetical protein